MKRFYFGLLLCPLFSVLSAKAQSKEPFVRLARIEVDPVQLDNYKALLKEEIEASLRIEPGVLTLYAVSEVKNPAHISIFETYADTAAYQAHLKRPHFLKYKAAVKDMVKALELVEVTPIAGALLNSTKHHGK